MLAAVAQLAPDAYGVSVRERVGEMLGGTTPSAGTIHRVLTRLERVKLVEARMGDPTPVRGGRAKRLFSLSPAGLGALEAARRDSARRAAALSPTWRSA